MDKGHAGHRRIVGVLLAAGSSTRLGAPKQLLPFGSKTLIEHALDILLRSPVDEVIVVLGAQADEITPLVQHPRVRIVLNPDWEQGQSASLRTALDALPPDCEAVVFLPCDMPWIIPELIADLIRAWQQTGKPVVVTAAGEKRGVPALFARETFAELRRASGDQGGRGMLQKHPDRVSEVRVAPEVLADIDTPEEYQRALEQLHQRSKRE